MSFTIVDDYFQRYRDFVDSKVRLGNSNLASSSNDDNGYYTRLNLGALGLAGESGEVVDLLKKVIHGKELDRSKLVDEMGDVLWYFTLICNVTGLSFDEIMKHNMNKLNERYGK